MNTEEYRIAENLPSSINRQNVRDVAEVIDEELIKLHSMAELVLLYPRIDELSSDLVDALALSLHVDFYDETLPLSTRRELVKNSTRWHMRKGTKGIVQEMVNTVWGGCEIKEWFDYDGVPFHFRVVNITAEHVDGDVIRNVLRAIRATKNVRSWLDGIWFLRKTEIPHYYAMIPAVHKRHVLGPRWARDALLDISPSLGAAPAIYKRHILAPRKPVRTAVDIVARAGSANACHKRIVLWKRSDTAWQTGTPQATP